MVNDYPGPVILSLLGGVLRKDRKQNYCQCMFLMPGEKIMTLGAASSLLCAGVSVSPGHFIGHLSALGAHSHIATKAASAYPPAGSHEVCFSGLFF